MVRSIALGTGLVAGTLRFLNRSDGERATISGANQAIKRAMDLACSAFGLVLSAPLLALLAALIRLGSPGPAFFVQERIGKDGRPFRMFKLRTMVDGAEEMRPALASQDAIDDLTRKVPDDPRVTRVGRVLRRTSLDELPQLWNVLRGEMSLVGPRPEETRIVERYSDWHRKRLVVKPGMTGPMQIGGRAALSLDDRTLLEIEYIEHYSLWRDLCILARTVGAILSGRGAY
jgi:lipopolysaccharide/colanic/teichoic acid biosynthesis glycosyltransferase